MNTYIFRAALWCEDCIEQQKAGFSTWEPVIGLTREFDAAFRSNPAIAPDYKLIDGLIHKEVKFAPLECPGDPDDENTYDSFDFPKGPYSDGGGEADTVQHCDGCGCHLENPLTGYGVDYVRQSILDHLCSNDGAEDVIETWRAFYHECEPSNMEIAAELLAIALPDVKRHPTPSPKRLRWIKTCERVMEEGI